MGVVRLNPPFDRRILPTGQVNAVNHIQRGWIVTQNTIPGVGGRARIDFMYNPSTISVDHVISPNVSQNPQAVNPNLAGTQLGPLFGIGSIDVPLLFDRTYELWDKSLHGTMPGQLGCYADVLAFYRMLQMLNIRTGKNQAGGGLFDGFINRAITSVQEALNLFNNAYPLTIGQWTPVYIYIANKLKYYGAISDLNVTYTHWNQDMVPMRCAVDCSVTLQVDSSTVPNGGKKSSSGSLQGGKNK